MEEILIKIIVVLFATGTGLICLYSLIFLYLVHRGRRELMPGDFKKILDFLLFPPLIGFVYALWTLLLGLGVIKPIPLFKEYFFNILTIAFLISITYVAFLIKEVGQKFGFKGVGKKIGELIKKKKKNLDLIKSNSL